jgi:Na+/H+ antiporter NhaD/arsenite permease-like protein
VSDSTITFLILAVVVAVFVWDRLPVEIVAVGTALSLWATVVLDYEQGFAGFGDPTVIFIASLFVVSEGLDAAGVTLWAGQELILHAGESRTRPARTRSGCAWVPSGKITVSYSPTGSASR